MTQVEEKVTGKLEDEVFVPNLEEEARSALLGYIRGCLQSMGGYAMWVVHW